MAASDLLHDADGRLRATWRLIAFVALVIVGTSVAQWIVLVVAGGAQAITGEPFDTTTTAYAVTLLAAHAIMLRRVDRRSWTFVRMGREAWRARPLLWGAAVGALAIGLPTALLLGVGWLATVAAPEGSWWSAAFRLTPFFAVAALWEELAFRGYLFSTLEEMGGRWLAVGVTSALFGIAHLQNPGATLLPVALVALAGVFLSLVMLATRSLAAAWMAHLAFNWMQAVAFHVEVSGSGFPTPGYRVIDAGPDWATGGAWGPEGGLAALLGMALGLVILTRGNARLLAARSEKS